MYSAHTNHPKTILALVLGSALVSGALAVAFYTSQSQAASRPGSAVGDSSSHASGLTYTVEHQHIVFSWQPVDGVLHYRLLASTSPASDADDEFSTVLGAGQIKQNVFRLRIRHWNVDWSSTRYQLQACPPAALPCRVLDEVELTPEDAERAVADLWHPDIQPALDFQLRKSLALSGDGDTMAWSGRVLTKDSSGRPPLGFSMYRSYSQVLYIAQRTSNGWQQQAKFWIEDEFDALESKAVALSANGDTLVFGSVDQYTQNEQNAKAASRRIPEKVVLVYERHKGSWQQQAIIAPVDTDQSHSFGASFALSADGSTLAVGNPYRHKELNPEHPVHPAHPEHFKQSRRSLQYQAMARSFSYGAVFVYKRIDGHWQQQAHLKAPVRSSGDAFGKSLSLSADGHTLAVGEPSEDADARSAAEAQALKNSPVVSDTPDGNPITPAPHVAEHWPAGTGAVYIYSRIGQTWHRQATVRGDAPDRSDLFGSSVSLSADGTVLAAGAPNQSGVDSFFRTKHLPESEYTQRAGATYLFVRQADNWVQTEHIKVNSVETQDGFGAAVSLSADGTVLAAGAPEEGGHEPGTSPQSQRQCAKAGAVYIFDLTEHKVIKRRRLISPHARLRGLYGAYTALSADANTLAVAAPGWKSSYMLYSYDGDPAEHEKRAQYQRPDLQWIFVY